MELTNTELCPVLGEVAKTITGAVHDVMESTPPELVGDIYRDGIVMTGGGSLLYGMDKLICEQLKIDVHIAENPADCVINGCGFALRYIGQGEVDENGAVNPLSTPY